MKRYATICMAAVRQIIWKLLLVLVIMAAVELLLFLRVMPDAPVTNGRGFGYFIEQAGVKYAVFAAMLATVTILCAQGMDVSGTKSGYTLQRLSVSEPVVTTLWAAVHIGCILILWAVQLVLVLVFWRWYWPMQVGHLAPQLELFVEFYRTGFLHSLLPMVNVFRWLRNISWILCLGVSSAHHGFVQRRGKHPVLSLAVVTLGWVAMDMTMGSTGVDGLLALIYLTVLGVHLHRIWRRSDEED